MRPVPPFIKLLPVLVVFGGVAQAQTISPLFPPITGLTIMEPTNQLSGATSSTATWRVSNYNAPAGFALGDFTWGSWGGYTATSPVEHVTYNPSASRDLLYQDGATLPCSFAYTGGVKVDEWDLFLSPDSVISYPPLSTLSHLYLSGTAQAWGYAEADAVCGMDVGVVSDSLTIWDATTQQNFYEQFAIVKFGSDGKVLPPGLYDTGWFATGVNDQTDAPGTFGYNHRLDQMGMTPIATGVVQPFDIDILAAIEADIKAGAVYGMDQDLSHWQISGGFAGTSLWGHGGITARLGKLSLSDAAK